QPLANSRTATLILLCHSSSESSHASNGIDSAPLSPGKIASYQRFPRPAIWITGASPQYDFISEELLISFLRLMFFTTFREISSGLRVRKPDTTLAESPFQ